MDDFVVDLFKKLERNCKALAESSSAFGKTVIVHPQVYGSAEEAAETSGDWKKKEQKQLMENLESSLE